MTAWRTNMLIYPSSWGWRHKTSIGNFKKGYYPTFSIAPLCLAPGERLEALTAFSNFIRRLSTQMGVVNACQCMSMHIMHIAVLFVSEQSSWQLVSCHTGCTICSASIAGAHHRDSGIIYTLRTCLCLSADPLPSRKKQKSTIACTCLSRTINSAKWTNSSTLQRILTGSSNPDWKLESACKVQDCEATPEYPLYQSTRYIFLGIFLIHYSKEIFGGGHEAYECLEYLQSTKHDTKGSFSCRSAANRRACNLDLLPQLSIALWSQHKGLLGSAS